MKEQRKRIAVLLNGPIHRDSRVIKTVRSLSKSMFVDLYYLGASAIDGEIFNENVGLFSYPSPKGVLNFLIRHTFFYREHLFLAEEVIRSGNHYHYVYANDLPCLLPGIKVKNVLGSALVYDSHEIYVETLNQFFPDRAPFHKQLMHRFSLFVMKASGRMAVEGVL